MRPAVIGNESREYLVLSIDPSICLFMCSTVLGGELLRLVNGRIISHYKNISKYKFAAEQKTRMIRKEKNQERKKHLKDWEETRTWLQISST